MNTPQVRRQPTTLPPLNRLAEIDATAAAKINQARTLRLSFSSTFPVKRWFGSETLSHSIGAADLSRLNDGAPLLFNHNPDDVIGVVEQAHINSAQRKGFATVRFANTARADEVLSMVQEGVLRNVSFMYRVDEYAEEQEDAYTATRWQPLEISIVSIPADPTVGVGRSIDTRELPVRIRKGTAIMQIEEDSITPLTRSQRRAVASDLSEQRSAAEMERERILEITGLCRAHKVNDEVRDALLRDGSSISAAKGVILEIIRRQPSGETWHHISELSEMVPAEGTRNARSFSLSRAIMAAASGDWRKAGYEREVSAEIGRRSGRDTSGVFIPLSALAPQRRDYNTLTPAAGGAVVATDLLGGSFIDVLRARCRVLQLGATVLSGLVGNVDIPRRTAAGPAQWITEGQSLTQGQGAFDVVSLRPKTVGSITTISRNLLMQGTPDAEMLVRADMVAVLAAAIDLAAIKGAGAAGQPLGILNQAGIGSVVGGTDGAAITYDHLIELAGVVAAANADGPAQGYLLNPQTITTLLKLKTTQGAYLVPVGASNGETVAPAGGGFAPGSDRPAFTALGFPVAASSNVPSDLTKGAGTNLSAAIFGNWADLLIGEWGVLEVLPNPYASGAYEAGAVQIRAMQTLDIAVRHAQSFAAMKDAITS